MCKVGYIHGFNSGPNSSTGKALKEIFPDLKICCWDSSGTFKDNLNDLILQTLGLDVIIGTSMGGYFADFLSDMLGFSAILINPVIDPYKTLKQFLGTNKSFDDGHSYELTEDAIDSYKGKTHVSMDYPKLVIIGTEDNIVNPVEVNTFYKGKAKIIEVPFGHQIPGVEILKLSKEFELLCNNLAF